MDVIDIWQQQGARGPAMALWGNLVSVYKHKEVMMLKKMVPGHKNCRKRHLNLQHPGDMKR